MVGNDRVLLNACLNKILDKEDIEENVKLAEEVLRAYANHADQTMDYLRTRLKSRFLKEQLRYDDLNVVGRYSGRKRKKKNQRIFSFRKDGRAVEFYFRRQQYSFEEFVKDLHESGREYDDVQVQRQMQEDLISTFYGSVFGKENFRHHSESALGSESRTIDHYLLEKVDVLEINPRFIFSIPWFPDVRRETVYRQE